MDALLSQLDPHITRESIFVRIGDIAAAIRMRRLGKGHEKRYLRDLNPRRIAFRSRAHGREHLVRIPISLRCNDPSQRRTFSPLLWQ
jgi:hypothetical protein